MALNGVVTDLNRMNPQPPLVGRLQTTEKLGDHSTWSRQKKKFFIHSLCRPADHRVLLKRFTWINKWPLGGRPCPQGEHLRSDPFYFHFYLIFLYFTCLYPDESMIRHLFHFFIEGDASVSYSAGFSSLVWFNSLFCSCSAVILF